MASLEKLLEDGGAPPADEEAVGKGKLAYEHPLVERYVCTTDYSGCL